MESSNWVMQTPVMEAVKVDWPIGANGRRNKAVNELDEFKRSWCLHPIRSSRWTTTPIGSPQGPFGLNVSLSERKEKVVV